MTKPKLLIASAICSAVFLLYIISTHLPGSRFAVVFKDVSIGLLVILAATHGKKLLALGLAASAVGDFLLGVRHLGPLGPVQLFLFGLISFLVAHLFYVVMFVTNRSGVVMAWRQAACGVVVLVAVVSLLVLWHGLAEMRIPVLIYSLVLTAMAVTAQMSRFPSLVAIGALSFVASDTMLAMTIFGHPFPGSPVLVWITYYTAQAMIAVGVLRLLTFYSYNVTTSHR